MGFVPSQMAAIPQTNNVLHKIVALVVFHQQHVFIGHIHHVAEGDKIPRKGGPGITRSDLLVINKIDLAPYVNADLNVMERDSKKMRRGKPFVFTNLMKDKGLENIIGWIKKYALMEDENEPNLIR